MEGIVKKYFPDGGFDSFEYERALNERFDIDMAYEKCHTLRDIVVLISNEKKRDRREHAMDFQEIWNEVRRITSYELGIVEHDLSLDTKLIEDLGF